mgnify:CR=1 FL=1
MCTSPMRFEPLAPIEYQPGYVLRHPTLTLNLLALAVSVISLPLLGVITWELHGGVSALPIEVTLTFLDIPVALIAAIFTIVFHELIHTAVLRSFGYRVSYGIAWRLLVAYAAAFRQLQRRDHALVTAVTPLALITVIALPLLATSSQYIVMFAFSVLLTNTAGAVSDMYLAWQLLRLPRQTLLYDVDTTHMIIFVPTCSSRRGG